MSPPGGDPPARPLGRTGPPHDEVPGDLRRLAVEHNAPHRVLLITNGARADPAWSSAGPEDALELGVGVDAELARVATDTAQFEPAERRFVVALGGVDAAVAATELAIVPIVPR